MLGRSSVRVTTTGCFRFSDCIIANSIDTGAEAVRAMNGASVKALSSSSLSKADPLE